MSQRNERSEQASLNSVAHWLIHQAAHRAPETLSARLEEEWLADFESRSTALSRLRFAVGCCWASVVIVNEYPRTRVPAASPVAAASAVAPATKSNTSVVFMRGNFDGESYASKPGIPVAFEEPGNRTRA